MAISAAQLIGLVEIRGADTSIAKLASVGAATDSAGAKLAGLAVGGTVLAAAGLIALGAAAVKMDADLQQGINRLKTGGGDVQDSFKSLWTGIQKVADATGVLTGPLTDSMYLIVSAGQRGTQAFSTLTAAAQGAQIEMANVKDVTQILTTIQTDWGIKTHTAAQYMDGLVKVVSEGKISLEDLSTAMSPILPIAAEFGIKFADVASAMSVQTNAGLDASKAATGLQAVMVNLENPTAKAAKAMKEYGVNATAVADEMKTSLPGAFQMLIDAALKVGPMGSVPFNQAMADMVGGGTRTAKTIDALDQNMKAWRGDIADVNSAMGDTSKNVAGWDTAQSNLNIKLQEGLASLQTLGQNIGMVILPYVSQLLDNVTPLIGRFQDWFVTSGREATVLQDIGSAMSILGNVIGTTVGILGGIIGAFRDAGAGGQALRAALVALGVVFAEIKIFQFAQGIAGTIVFLKDLIPAVWGSTVAFGAMDIALGPIALVIGGIAAAAGAAMLVFTHWDQITKGVGATFDAFGRSARDTFSNTQTHITQAADSMGGAVHKLQLTTDQSANLIVGDGIVAARSWGAANKQMADSERAAEATITQSAQAMATNVTVASQTMASNLLNAVSGVVGKAGQSFDQLLSQVDMDMSSIDTNSKQYWADVMNYIEGNPINGHITISGPEGVSIQTSATTQAHAEGTSYAPGGWSWVGERGPEMMYVPRGAQIVPHAQSVGGGSSGSGQPLQVNIYLAGQRVESVLLPGLVTAIRNATGARF